MRQQGAAAVDSGQQKAVDSSRQQQKQISKCEEEEEAPRLDMDWNIGRGHWVGVEDSLSDNNYVRKQQDYLFSNFNPPYKILCRFKKLLSIWNQRCKKGPTTCALAQQDLLCEASTSCRRWSHHLYMDLIDGGHSPTLHTNKKQNCSLEVRYAILFSMA